jgi:type VI protein secretion system component VasF
MNEDEKTDQLWQLLGKAKQPAVSPFFARNILRAVREEEQAKRTPLAWLRWSWRVALAGAFAVVVAFSFIGHPLNPKKNNESQALLTQQIVNNADYDVIKDLDELLAYEENSIWLDDSIN